MARNSMAESGFSESEWFGNTLGNRPAPVG